MPSSKHFPYFGEALRSHPFVVASTAATVGVLMGGFVTVELLAPTQPRPGQALQVAAETKPKGAQVPAADTTGAATTENVASECDRQTWPNLSKMCMEEYRIKNRANRIIPLDKIDLTAATDGPSTAETKPVSPAPAMPVAVQPVAATPAPVETELKAPEPPPISLPAVKAIRAAPPAAAVFNEKKAAKAKRKMKKLLTKPDADDDSDTTIASAYAEDRTIEKRFDRTRRIVERWTERDYVVPNADGREQRRITVIHRSGGGLYGSLFGN